jgi:dipeptidyl aminopeptidase/acylaminoacyl peptidase
MSPIHSNHAVIHVRGSLLVHLVRVARGVAIGIAAAATLVVVAPDAARAQQRAASNRNAIPHAEPRSEITFEDLASIGSLGAPALSPDGRELALVQEGQIVLVPADGGWPSPLTTTVGGKSGVAWSPDGRSIAFVSEGSIWVVPTAGGAPTRVTDSRPGRGDPRAASDRQPQWSPDGAWILFETGRRGNNDVAVVSADGLTTNIITTTDADESAAAWSPDGKQIAYVERTLEHFSGRLLIVPIDPATGRTTGTPRELYVAKDDRGGGWSIRRPVWSPDGKQLAVVLQDSGWDQIYLLPAAGGAPHRLTQGEFEDGDPTFSPDGRALAITSNRANLEEQHIWIVPLDGSQPRRLTPATVGVESNPQWSPDGQRVYFSRSTPLEPTSVFVAAVAAKTSDAAPRAVLRVRARNFECAGFSAPEEVHYKSKDGVDIAALLYKPTPRTKVSETGAAASAASSATSAQKPPAILWIHGGPEGQDVFSFDPWAFFLTQRGYLVLRPNYRGSTGYGEHFRNLNVEDSGGGEVDDIAAGAQFLITQGLADPARLGIGGGSHGGTMVAYAVTKYPTLFHVAIDLYGVTDRASYNERTNRNAAIRWTRKMGGTPAEKPELYRKANVLPDVPKITAPLLIMHGEDDPQVPPYESAQFVAALKRANKPYLYFTYPKEGHGFTQRDHRLDAWRKEIAFLDRYLQPSYGHSITSTQEIVLDDKP